MILEPGLTRTGPEVDPSAFLSPMEGATPKLPGSFEHIPKLSKPSRPSGTLLNSSPVSIPSSPGGPGGTKSPTKPGIPTLKTCTPTRTPSTRKGSTACKGCSRCSTSVPKEQEDFKWFPTPTMTNANRKSSKDILGRGEASQTGSN
jgi:hypothetical protein